MWWSENVSARLKDLSCNQIIQKTHEPKKVSHRKQEENQEKTLNINSARVRLVSRPSTELDGLLSNAITALKKLILKRNSLRITDYGLDWKNRLTIQI